MRSFTLLIFSLGIILTANLGLTSPVPDFVKNLRALISADNNHNIATRDVANPVTDLAADAEQGGTYRPFWDLGNCHGKHGLVCLKRVGKADANDTVNNGVDIAKRDTTGAAVDLGPNREEGFKRSDDGNVVSDANLNIDHLASSTSSNTLFERQLVDPITAEMNKPCAKAIFAKYDHTDLTTLSDADKTALVDAIMNCHNNPSQDTTTPNLPFHEATDLTTTGEAPAVRCTREEIIKAYLWALSDVVDPVDKTNNWFILLRCLGLDPNSATQPPKLRGRQWEIFDSDGMACIIDVEENFKGDRNKPEDVAAMWAEVRDKCGFKDKSELGSVVTKRLG